MARTGSIGMKRMWAGMAVLAATGMATLWAQAGGRNAQALFKALDANGDGTLTHNEIESGFNSWFKAWDTTNRGTLTADEISAGLSKVLPATPAARPGQGNTF